jgi:Uma2 family endonuclease
MPTLVNNPRLEEELIADRRDRGIDKFDEVWDGVYVMAPIANNEHQVLQTRLSAILSGLIDFTGLGQVFNGANVSDQEEDWTKNYRVPDLLVFFNGNPAEDRSTHWFGGPDFAVEIVSRWDRSREKTDFYASVGVRELLIIDRDPWQLELFRLTNGRLASVAVATESNKLLAESQVVPISLRLTGGEGRPGIAVTSRDGQSWTI